jgi:hypothetical protein
MITNATKGFCLAALLTAAAVPAVAQTIDGQLDGVYGAAKSTQTTQTQFGDNTMGQVDNANGSELDHAYATLSATTLRLFFSGNLESNFNHLEIFFDTRAGGQNKLRGDNSGVDFGGLNRMGDDGSGNGLIFETGYEADYWMGLGGGGGPPYQIYANLAELLTGGGGPGNYLGSSGAGSNGVLSGGTNPDNVRVTIDNHNVAGVTGGCAAAVPGPVPTGVEIEIPLVALGNPSGCIRVVAFVNGSAHDFVSNQVLGPLAAGTCNLGEPRAVDFRQQAGLQEFQICPDPTPVDRHTWGRIKAIYR